MSSAVCALALFVASVDVVFSFFSLGSSFSLSCGDQQLRLIGIQCGSWPGGSFSSSCSSFAFPSVFVTSVVSCLFLALSGAALAENCP